MVFVFQYSYRHVVTLGLQYFVNEDKVVHFSSVGVAMSLVW
jgi:hypothetical protein